MQEMGQAMNAEVRKGLTDILKPEQVKRFEQIQLQQMGVLGAPAMPRVQEALNLTDDQKSKLRTIQEEQREAMTRAASRAAVAAATARRPCRR